MTDKDRGEKLEPASQKFNADFLAANKPQQKAQEGEGSQQVKNTAPRLELRPSGAIRNAVDREAHQIKMKQDDQAAKNLLKKSEAQMNQINAGKNMQNSLSSTHKNTHK